MTFPRHEAACRPKESSVSGDGCQRGLLRNWPGSAAPRDPANYVLWLFGVMIHQVQRTLVL